MNKSDFIEVPIEIVNAKEAEIIGEDNAPRDLVRAMFLPGDISFYRADPGNDKDPIERTTMHFKNGHELTAVMSIEEFEKLIFNE